MKCLCILTLTLPKLKLLSVLLPEYILVALMRINHVLLMALHLQVSLQIHLFTYF